MRTKNDSCRGGALLESSLIMLVFLTTLLAIVDVAQFLYLHQTLSERVRNAARYAALHWDGGCDQQCVVNMVVYRSTTVPENGVPTDGLRIPNLTTANVAVTMPDTSFDARVVVTIQNFNFAVFTPGISPTGYLRGRAITASAPIEDPN